MHVNMWKIKSTELPLYSHFKIINAQNVPDAFHDCMMPILINLMN